MAILNDEESKALFELTRQKNELQKKIWLHEAKEKSVITGKEVFNYEKLRTFVDPDYYADAGTLEKRIERLEYKYYVDNSDIMTLKDFADHIIEVYKWKE
jgi:hypothetical protein